ncbi:MAG: hydroxyacylglutathione hydrolase [Rhodoferax sp.]|nr:hydroxyacylglutathione hydrolase [Rhodoferax sp.]
MKLIPIPAFNDNYIWMLHDGHRALVVDPGDAQPVLAALTQHELTLDSILVTHHHGDHTGGVDVLRQRTGAQVYGPATEDMPEPLRRLVNGDVITLLGLRLEVLLVPGHTTGHIAYWGQVPGADPVLFCGDTLFSAGCGRLFEGTPAQMLASLTRLAALPDATRVCCAHEYTLGSLRFALAVEPDNADLLAYQKHAQALRQQLLPTLPSSIGLEKAVNPFLRTHLPSLVHAVQQIDPNAHDPVAVFAALRTWKDKF